MVLECWVVPSETATAEVQQEMGQRLCAKQATGIISVSSATVLSFTRLWITEWKGAYLISVTILPMWDIRQPLDISLQGCNHPIWCKASSINGNGPSTGTYFRLTLLYSMNTSWWSWMKTCSIEITDKIASLWTHKWETLQFFPTTLFSIRSPDVPGEKSHGDCYETKTKTNWQSPYEQIAANHSTITTNGAFSK